MAISNFLDVMMKNILEGSKIPKVQVEREIGPILGMFLPAILTNLFSQDTNSSYQMIMPEFPLKKKENNQSTNIDYLLINKNEKKIVLFELKTDRSSFNDKQKTIYEELKKTIRKQSAFLLIKNLEFIRDASKKPEKYQYVFDRCKKYRELFKEIKTTEIIYLTPKTFDEPQANNIITISFGDLPEKIQTDYHDEWRIIRKYLIKLDDYPNGIKHSKSVKETISQNIISFIEREEISVIPTYVSLGKSGDKVSRPNYQVAFNDGRINTFYFSGKRHKTPKFNEKNLNPKIAWKDFIKCD